MARTIEIIVSRTGETSLSVQGVKGANCKDLTKQLESMLGQQIASANTAEFFEEEEVHNEVKNQWGV